MMVRYASGHKEESLARIVQAAGRGFRKQGFGGIGVDGLAKEAGVTHGAFYGHFRSKSDAFKAAVVAGLKQLAGGIAATREKHGSGWVAQFVEFYLGYKRTCDLGDACTVPVLSPEIERADLATREAYETELLEVVKALAAGFPKGSDAEKQAQAWVLMSLLSGGVTLARAVPSAELSDAISKAVSSAALRLAGAN
jgi:TetR/AcrR family transcriptional regulator, transcriptional repressor for nem operon